MHEASRPSVTSVSEPPVATIGFATPTTFTVRQPSITARCNHVRLRATRLGPFVTNDDDNRSSTGVSASEP